MEKTFIPYDFPRDWHNYHFDGRQSWLAWPWPEPKRPTLVQQLRRMLQYLGGHVNSVPPGWKPDPPEHRA